MVTFTRNQLSALLSPWLDNLVHSHDVVSGALVATVDGHLVAIQGDSDLSSARRLASMGSSLVSLGDSVTAELAMGRCRNIIAENENGFVTFIHINKKLILVTMTANAGRLGMLLSASRNCAQAIARSLTNPEL